jgi:microcystin-dependent protein
MSATRNSRAFSNVQLQSLRYQRNAIPAAGGLLTVGNDGVVHVAANPVLDTLTVLGASHLNNVTANTASIPHIQVNGGITVAAIHGTTATLDYLNVFDQANINRLYVSNETILNGLEVHSTANINTLRADTAYINTMGVTTAIITTADISGMTVQGAFIHSAGIDALYIGSTVTFPTTVVYPAGSTAYMGIQIAAGTTYSVDLSGGEALIVKGDANISGTAVIDTAVIESQLIVNGATVIFPDSSHRTVMAQTIVAGTTDLSILPLPYQFDVSGTAHFSGNVTMDGGLTVSSILSGTTANFSQGVSMGALTATTGNFSGAITSAGIAGTTANFSQDVSMGALTATTGNFSGAITSAGISGTTAYFSQGVSMGALTATMGNFSGAITSTGISGTTAYLSNVAIATGLSVNSIGSVSGNSIYFNIGGAPIIMETSDTIMSISQPSGRISSYSSSFTNSVGINSYNNGAGLTLMKPNISGMFLGSVNSDPNITILQLVNPSSPPTGTTFLTFNTSNNRMGVLNPNPAATVDISGGLNVSGSIVSAGISTSGLSVQGNLYTNAIGSYSSTTITLQPTGQSNIVLGNSANTGSSNSVIAYPFMSMTNGAYVSGNYGLQIAQTSGLYAPTPTTGITGTGAALGYNAYNTGSYNLELVIAKGGVTSGGGFNIFNTSSITSNAPSTKTLALDNSGNLSITGLLTVVGAAPGYPVPVGTIVMYGGSVPPTGWLLCDGTTYSTTGTYAALFVKIGTVYNPSTPAGYFNVPDLRSRVPVGQGQGPGILYQYPLGNKDGVEIVTLDSTMIPGHTHNFGPTNTNTGYAQIAGSVDVVGYVASYNTHDEVIKAPNNNDQSNDTIDIPSGTFKLTDGGHIHQFSGTTNPNTGGGGPHENRQPFLVINYIIKY